MGIMGERAVYCRCDGAGFSSLKFTPLARDCWVEEAKFSWLRMQKSSWAEVDPTLRVTGGHIKQTGTVTVSTYLTQNSTEKHQLIMFILETFTFNASEAVYADFRHALSNLVTKEWRGFLGCVGCWPR